MNAATNKASTYTAKLNVAELPSNSKMPARSRHLAIHFGSKDGNEVRFAKGEVELTIGDEVWAVMAATANTGQGARRRQVRLEDVERCIVTGNDDDSVRLLVHLGANSWDVSISGLRRLDA